MPPFSPFQHRFSIYPRGPKNGVHFNTWVGKVAYFNEAQPYLVNQRVGILRPKTSCDLDRRYFSYLLSSEFYQKEFIAIATSSGGQANLSPAQILAAPVELPTIDAQKAIANILGALDDKIELNRRMNGTLEGMARALFQSWFVDFDPVRAKQAGRAPANLDPATAALFPDDFESSELGEIPKGWRVVPLREIAEIIMGTSPPGDTYNDLAVGTALINGPNEFGSRFPLKSKWTTASVREAQTSDLIFCVRGSTGRRVIADDVYGLGRGVCSIRGRSGSQPFVNELITHELPRLLERTTGSVFSSLSAPDLREFSIPCPPQRIVDHFVSIVGIWHKKQDRLEFESGTLASIRNVLLPKLLSGALPVDQMDSVEGM